MTSAEPSGELSRRVEKVVGYPPLSEMSDHQRREFLEAERSLGREPLPGYAAIERRPARYVQFFYDLDELETVALTGVFDAGALLAG